MSTCGGGGGGARGGGGCQRIGTAGEQICTCWRLGLGREGRGKGLKARSNDTAQPQLLSQAPPAPQADSCNAVGPAGQRVGSPPSSTCADSPPCPAAGAGAPAQRCQALVALRGAAVWIRPGPALFPPPQGSCASCRRTRLHDVARRLRGALQRALGVRGVAAQLRPHVVHPAQQLRQPRQQRLRGGGPSA